MLKRSLSVATHSSYFCIRSETFASPVEPCRLAAAALCKSRLAEAARLPPSVVFREASTIFMLAGLESVQYLIMGLVSFFCTSVFSAHCGCLKDLTRKLSGRPCFIVRSQGYEGTALPPLQAGVSVFLLNLRCIREAMGLPRQWFSLIEREEIIPLSPKAPFRVGIPQTGPKISRQNRLYRFASKKLTNTMECRCRCICFLMM